MDSIEKRLLEHRKDILNLARKHGAYNIIKLGSGLNPLIISSVKRPCLKTDKPAL